MFRRRRSLRASPAGLLTSGLFDQTTFYKKFASDLSSCRNEAIIESPFITTRRLNSMLPTIHSLTKRGVTVTINTKDPAENNDLKLAFQAHRAVRSLQDSGAKVLFTTGHHRKLAILDRAVLWEGSLNILSQNNSCEIMRRVESAELAEQMIGFIELKGYLR
jgi:hypothetical protein